MDLVVSEDLDNITKLELLVASVKKLEKAGYVVEPLTFQEASKKTRCLKCGKSPHKAFRPRNKPKGKEKEKETPSDAAAPGTTNDNVKATDSKVNHESPDADLEEGEVTETQSDLLETLQIQDTETGEKPADGKESKPKIVDQCYWHPERFSNRRFPCCGGHMFSLGCQSQRAHEPEDMHTASFRQRWTYHYTPAASGRRVRRAVALDCEMGCGMNGDEELIRLSMVDYFTGEVLVDSLVFPLAPLRHCSTPWSGIVMKDLYDARARGRCFMGRDKARNDVFKHVGPETIVVLHGGVGDLNSLRWIHTRVVDTAMLERRLREEHRAGGLSLKKLCEVRLGLQIQQGYKGRKGHDSLEDAQGCRVLAHFYASAGTTLEVQEDDEEAESKQENVNKSGKGKGKRRDRKSHPNHDATAK